MASRYGIDLSRSDHGVAWGFRLQGGSEFGTALSIQRVFSGSPSDGNLQRGDVILSVNGSDVTNSTLVHAQDMIKSSGNRLSLFVQREGAAFQDLHVSTTPFASQSRHDEFSVHSPHTQPSHQPTQQFNSPPLHTQLFVAPQNSPVPAVSSVKFQPKGESQHHHQPQQNYQPPQQIYQSPQHDYQAPQHNDQHAHQHPQHIYQQEDFSRDEEQQEQGGDVDAEHLKPVREIKNMFNHAGVSHDGSNVIKKGQPVRMNQPRKGGPQLSTKYQPPSPSVKPPAVAASHPQSLKQPPVYQQRSSYNPLDFQGINPKSPIPPNRPPGLIQRGAIDVKPVGSGGNYHQPDHVQPAHPAHQAPTSPHISSSANIDPMTDFYLHGLSAKSGMPDLSKPVTAPYTGKVLPPRSEVAIKTPTGAIRKKEFKADQSAVYRILQEEEHTDRKGGPARGGEKSRGSGAAEVHQKQVSYGGPRLAELLEKDQSQLAPYQDGLENQQHHQQQQQYLQQQQQQQLQNFQQRHSPEKQIMTSSFQLVPAQSRHDHHHDSYHQPQQHRQHPQHQHQQQQQQQSWSHAEHGRRYVGHSGGVPETDF